jgi:benzylsuccinate CoA-transferase BbsE subunit
MLRGLGAEVILVEPPGGCAMRYEPPLAAAGPLAGTSLAFAYYGTGKQSVVLDLDEEQDRAAFRRLVQSADVLIEAEPPGALAALGLGHAALIGDRPSRVTASITPFGQDGPWADWRAEDIVAMALGGMMWLGGYKDGPPLKPAGEQAFLGASMFAATGIMAAVLAAERDGIGDHLDISIHESVVLGLENSVQFWDLEQVVRQREGGYQGTAGRGAFACADGHVYLMAGGIDSNRFWSNTVGWLEEARTPRAAELREPQWQGRAFLATDEAKRTFAEIFGAFAATRKKVALYQEAQARRVPLAPVATPADIAASPQLAARSFFVDVGEGDLAMRMPGAPYRLSATPWTAGGPAPRLGQDQAIVERLTQEAAS